MIVHGIKDIDVLLLFITLSTCVLQEKVLSMVTLSNFSEFETLYISLYMIYQESPMV